MRAGITGATGHLGANVTRRLLATGHDVRVVTGEPIDISPPALRGLQVERVCADIRDQGAIEDAFAGVDVVFHLAAKVSLDRRDASVIWDINFEGTKTVIDACIRSGVRRLVHVSSFNALLGKKVITDDTPLSTDRGTAYARSKAAAERLVANARDLETVVISPTAMIGPWDFAPSSFGKTLLDLFRGRIPVVPRSGVNLVDVRDVAAAMVRAGETPEAAGRYLVGGFWLKTIELGEIAASVAGVQPPRREVPVGLVRAAVPFAAASARLRSRPQILTTAALDAMKEHRLVLDNRARDELEHRPRPIESTVRDTYDWFAFAGAQYRAAHLATCG